MIKAKKISDWVVALALQVGESFKEYKSYRYQLVGFDKTTPNIKFLVMVNGIKKQYITFSPEELIVNDQILCEFSWYDVRAITFYALKSHEKPMLAECYIVGQDFDSKGKTIFIINKENSAGEYRYSAEELYKDDGLLKKFTYKDIKNIISSAVQERALNDFQRIEVYEEC